MRAAVIFCFGLLFAAQGCGLRQAAAPDRQVRETLRKVEEERSQQARQPLRMKPDHLELAQTLYARGLYEVALVELEEARKVDASNCEVLHLMGRCHLALGKMDEAEANFKKALQIDSKYAPALNGLGLTYDLSGSKSRAEEYYTKSIEINPARADFQCNLGFFRLRALQLHEAEKCFRAGLALDPQLAVAKNNLALCLALQKRYDEAFALLKQGVPLAQAYNNLGVFYEMNGDRDSATRCYREALKRDASLLQARRNLLASAPGAAERLDGSAPPPPSEKENP
jgi:Tfp pilus assembly protein PilF